MDRDDRELERLLQANPDDQELLIRVTVSRERSGHAPPPWLAFRELYPGSSLATSEPLELWTLDPGGRPGRIGRVGTTSAAREVAFPVHRAWWALPLPGATPEGVAAALADAPRPGLALSPACTDAAPWARALPWLERLDLSGCTRLTDSGVTGVGPLERTSWLGLWYCRGLTDGALAWAADLPNLQSLDLSHCARLTGAGLQPLSSLERLLALRAAHLPGLDRAGIAAIARLSSLLALDLRGCPLLDDAALRPLRDLDQLALLNLAGCRALSAGALETLGALSGLSELILVGCDEALRAAAPETLRRALPACRVVV